MIPEIAINIPTEIKITPDGETKATQGIVFGSSREAVVKATKIMEEKHEVEFSGDGPVPAEEFFTKGGSSNFGFSNWGNCQWKPKGPKKPWVNPENPSNN